jgi:hypothetical protein
MLALWGGGKVTAADLPLLPQVSATNSAAAAAAIAAASCSTLLS